MLPYQLLVARARGGFILPSYSKLDDLELYIADKMIEVFENSIGCKRKSLEAKVKDVENLAFRLGLDYRFARGLAHLLYKRTLFEKPETKLDPLRSRLEIFKEVNKKFSGFVINDEERAYVLSKVASKFGVDTSELLNAFMAVHEEEHLVKDFYGIKAEELLKNYNLSLTQTLLFKSLNLTANVKMSGTEMKKLLFNVKRLGLMYMAEKTFDGVKLYIDGPASILKQSERYGTRLAKLIPYIICAEKWKISARILRNNRLYRFVLSDKFSRILPRYKLELVDYDSELEKIFYRRFTTLGSGWKLYREPEPLIAGRSVFIPDFVFEKDNVRVYFEIVGFWTHEYLKRKMEKLSSLRDLNMIIAVNQELACSTLMKDLPFNIIFFKRKLSPVEVYRRLKEYEKFVIKIEEKEEEEVPEKIIDYVKSIEEKKLSDVLKDLSKYGISEEKAIKILEKLGFEIDWQSLDPSKIIVRKKIEKI